MTPPIRLRGPSDLVALLPYQLGYHPERSLVVVAFHGSRMGLVQRLDLPPPEHVDTAAMALLRPLSNEQPESVVLFGYEKHEGESMLLLDAVADDCAASGIDVQDRIVVRSGRWYAPDCGDSCCPSTGTLVTDPSVLPAVAEFVGREIAPLRNRKALEQLVQVREPTRAARISAAAREPRRPPGLGASAHRGDDLCRWAELLRTDDDAQPVEKMEDDDVARLALSLADAELRDAVIAWICPGSLPVEMVDPVLREQLSLSLPGGWALEVDEDSADQVVAQQRLERRLVDLCASLEDECAAPALTVLAAFAWWRGDGALSRVALDRALGAAPGYRLALLLEQMVDLAIRPERRTA